MKKIRKAVTVWARSKKNYRRCGNSWFKPHLFGPFEPCNVWAVSSEMTILKRHCVKCGQPRYIQVTDQETIIFDVSIRYKDIGRTSAPELKAVK